MWFCKAVRLTLLHHHTPLSRSAAAARQWQESPGPCTWPQNPRSCASGRRRCAIPDRHRRAARDQTRDRRRRRFGPCRASPGRDLRFGPCPCRDLQQLKTAGSIDGLYNDSEPITLAPRQICRSECGRFLASRRELKAGRYAPLVCGWWRLRVAKDCCRLAARPASPPSFFSFTCIPAQRGRCQRRRPSVIPHYTSCTHCIRRPFPATLR